MRPLWEPSKERIENSNMMRFIKYVNEKHSLNIDGYHPLYDWSIANREDFWASLWDFEKIVASKTWDKVLEDSPTMIGAKWFIGARLNFAENLLRYKDDQLAIIFKGEGQPTRRMSYAQLYDEVARMAKSLRDAGVVKGDRVAGYLPNMPEAIIAMLAATSIGAIWSSCSPDFGIKGILDRFGQIGPKVLVAADGYFYNGKSHDSIAGSEVLPRNFPVWKKIVIVPYVTERPDLSPCRKRSFIGISSRKTRDLTSSSSSFRSIIPFTLCTHQARPDCPSAWCTGQGGPFYNITKNMLCTAI